MRAFAVVLLGCGTAIAQPTAPAKIDPKVPFAAPDPGGHAGEVRGVAFTPDGKSVVTAGTDRTVRVWDVATGEPTRVIRLPVRPGGGRLYALALAPDGKTAAVAGTTVEDGRDGSPIYLIDLSTGRVDRTLAEHTEAITSLSFGSEGKKLVSASLDRTARVWDVASGTCDTVLRGHTQGLSSVAFAPDGSQVATAAHEGTVRVWPAAGGKSALVLADRGTRSVAWTPDGRHLVGGNADGTVTVWEAKGKRLGTHDAPAPSDLYAVRVTPSGTAAVCAGTAYKDADDKQLRTGRVIDLGTGREYSSLAGVMGPAFDVAVSPDGSLAVSAVGPSGEAVVWKTRDGTVVRRLRGQGAAVAAVGSGPDGKTIAWRHLDQSLSLPAEFRLDRTFHCGDLRAGRMPDDPAGFTCSIRTHKGQRAIGFGERVRVIEGDEDISDFDLKAGDIRTLSWLGDHLLVVAANRGLFLTDPAEGTMLRRFAGETTEILTVAPAPDGMTFLTGGLDQTIRVWRADRARPLLSILPAGDEWIAWTEEGVYACSPGGERLLGWQADESRLKPGWRIPAARFRSSLYLPEVIRHVVTAGSVPAAFEAAGLKRPEKLSIPDLMPPTVEVTNPAASAEAGPKFDVTAVAKPTGGRPVRALRLLVNGRPYQGEASARLIKDGGEAKATWSVELPPGPHTLIVLADSAVSRGASTPVEVRIPGQPERPALYLLAVGVNDYPSPLKLKCAAADAEAVAKAFQGSKAFRTVEAKVLKDGEATKAAVETGLAWLHEKTGPGDVAIFLMSGRGEAGSGREYALLPHGADPANPVRTGISGATLTAALAKVRGKVLVFLDVARRRMAPADDLVRELLAEDCGAAVLAAARGPERAVEEPGAALGYFFQAVTDGLTGAADVDKDGSVWLHELEAYVPGRVKELSAGLLTPVATRPGGVGTVMLTGP